MQVTANIVVINGTEYITRQEAERLLNEADERRRTQMQEHIDALNRFISSLRTKPT